MAETGAQWNALDPNDEHSALIVPREDLRELQAEVERLRAERLTLARRLTQEQAGTERLREELADLRELRHADIDKIHELAAEVERLRERL